MNRLEALVALNMAAGIGSSRLAKLLGYFNQPQDVFAAPIEKLIAVSGITENQASRIHCFKQEDLTKELKLSQRLSLKIIGIEDEHYPENLRHIPGVPIVLYVKGDIIRADNLAIGIVGSRRPSFYGLSMTAKFASELALKAVTIVSGMARGVDTCAHRSALKIGGRTLAVMGSGFNNIYPEENKELVEDICRLGAVISEFPVNEQPLKENFPRRNRVISGLSLGILVTEAARNSGALITADFALEQGRDVFALPGKIDSPSSFGTNELIKQGAKLVSRPEEILEELNLSLIPSEKEAAASAPGLVTEKEAGLLGLISHEAAALDELVDKAGMDVSQISGILLKLQLRRLIKQLPGKQFVRVS